MDQVGTPAASNYYRQELEGVPLANRVVDVHLVDVSLLVNIDKSLAAVYRYASR
jgi:hypothetical protein